MHCTMISLSPSLSVQRGNFSRMHEYHASPGLHTPPTTGFFHAVPIPPSSSSPISGASSSTCRRRRNVSPQAPSQAPARPSPQTTLFTYGARKPASVTPGSPAAATMHAALCHTSSSEGRLSRERGGCATSLAGCVPHAGACARSGPSSPEQSPGPARPAPRRCG